MAGVGDGGGCRLDQTRLERGATCRLPKAARNRTERECKTITEKSVCSGDLQRTSRKELSEEEESFRRQEQREGSVPDMGATERISPPEPSLAVRDL